MTVRPTTRQPARPSAPQGKQYEMLHFPASLGACNLILHIHVVVSWQLSKQGICWPVSPDRIAGSGVNPSRLRLLFNLSLPLTSFQFSTDYTLISTWISLLKSFFLLTGASQLAPAKSIHYGNKFSFTHKLIKLMFAWMIVYQALLW